MKRRDFIKGSLLTGATFSIAGISAQAAEFVATDNPTAIALKYVEDAEQATRVEKMGVPGAEQICANCRFYADPNADAAACVLLANQLVPAKAWCAGWVPIS